VCTPTPASVEKSRRALALWGDAIPAIGTLAERYLGVRCLPDLATSPALRFHPLCPHRKGVRLPAMIALVVRADGTPIAIHRTFLRPDESGKADIASPRASLGPFTGRAIRLDPAGPELAIGEGIESSASTGRMLGLPAWSAVACGNLAENLILPPHVRSVVVVAFLVRTAGDQARTRRSKPLGGGSVKDGGCASRCRIGRVPISTMRCASVVRWAMADGFTLSDPPVDSELVEPDISVLRLNRRPAPALDLALFGPQWESWITSAADAAACPADFVVAPFLATASALIGNARWAQATDGWAEPLHLWIGAVGDPGCGKSPGTDCLMREVLLELERRMQGDFPDRLRDWRATAEIARAREESWKGEVKEAQKRGNPPPLPPATDTAPEPQAPRLRQNDDTAEKVASLLAAAAPKGLLIVRDELAGLLGGMNAYHDAGRAFWIEAYGGRPYRVERQRSPEPIVIPRLAVAVCGGTQPDKLATLFKEADDGLLARIIWCWPEPVSFRLATKAPAAQWATDVLDRLRLLELALGPTPDEPPRPIMAPLAVDALPMLEEFGRDMQERQSAAGGLMRSAYGKARGPALRLSLVIEMLRWCAMDGVTPPPAAISAPPFSARPHWSPTTSCR
jgi:hypothetical protein